MHNLFFEFWENFRHNLFKPLLLFFYTGFTVPLLGVKLDFPQVIYQGLTIYLLLAIGWHGGEELALLPRDQLANAAGFMLVGFLTNFVIGCLAYLFLRVGTRLRRVDAATVSGYYGSDSAGTFVTCIGVLTSARIVYAPYMPVMLAVMEIPGCLVALFLVAMLRRQGMDPQGNMPDEEGYDPEAKPSLVLMDIAEGAHGHPTAYSQGVNEEAEMALEKPNGYGHHRAMGKDEPILSPELLHEVFLNPGLFLLFAGIAIGFVSGFQGYTSDPDKLFLALFPGLLCLFLLEMGMTASRKLRDLRTAGWRFVVFGLLAPNLFATIGILVAHAYSMATHQPFDIGTYVLFSVLCGAASYIAVPAVQRLAIPEASPTLPLAASLGLTFSYNVTVGIPLYIQIAKLVKDTWPVA
ncbi:MAG: sodium-dependent bicarbonate transport family permease [Planctomycetaceae bacterium]|nr:sodium-dependent bicarbonate transport family permease [Planctomycetaceae bacterium]MBV8606545.1 sodium-dependent bicarbonate transport family permease [Singulisphaera sp.]